MVCIGPGILWDSGKKGKKGGEGGGGEKKNLWEFLFHASKSRQSEVLKLLGIEKKMQCLT